MSLNRLYFVVFFLNHHPLRPRDFSLILPGYSSPIEYITKRAPYSIGYGVPDEKFYIPQSSVFLEQNNVNTAHYYANKYHYLSQSLYAIENNHTSSAQPFLVNNHFQFDIFNTIFFHISRYEEVFANSNDMGVGGWLEESKHFLVKHDLYQNPVVDKIVVAFYETITQLKIQKKTTYSLSHDIDFTRRFAPSGKFVKSIGGSLLRREPFSQIKENIDYYIKMVKKEAKDPYDYFSTLFRTEKIWKFKYIYVMTGGETKFDNKYHPRDDELAEIMIEAVTRGYNIGLHPSYNAGFKTSLFEKEAEELSKITMSAYHTSRQHFLRFSWDKTPEIFAQNNILTDSSMGYTRRLGFRCGTGFSYFMYDFKEEASFPWDEQPLSLMDSAAIHATLEQPDTLNVYIQNFILANKENTHIELNFHNSNFDCLTTTGKRLDKFYTQELLALVS